ncbi:pyridoxal phosphate-dependent transferase [Naematelia encephala]|uniref:cystathionine gamma-lyase n=1 Tax=Naematelia encephala TaxID=71784 RepID=A0A1Y2AHG5_9TREE|nr:pyridoxal phosphate-dependent transferase [Naematelia encephala]
MSPIRISDTENRQSKPNDNFTTRSIHIGSEPDGVTGAVVPSLSVATTFKQYGVGHHTGFEYSRTGNPTRNQLEHLLTSLETSSSAQVTDSVDERYDETSGGADSLVFASGSAATATMCAWVSLAVDEGGAGGRDGVNGLGGHVLAVNDVYGGTARYLSRASKGAGLEVTFLDFEAAGEQGIREAIRPDTRLIWLEVPTNPLLLVPPLPLIAEIVASLPAESRPLVLVDTTFLSSFYITPLIPPTPNSLPLGDIVLSSMSKYSGGHSDLILGALTVSSRTVQARPNLLTGLRFLQNSAGAIPSPRDCHLMTRSLKTLSLRMIRHGLNALQIASWLNQQEKVADVRYPGLATDGAFHLVEKLLSPNARKELEFLGWTFPFKPTSGKVVDTVSEGSLAHVRTLGIPFGGIISFRLKDASAEETDRFCSGLRLVILAESLGGVESLIEVPSGMTHSGLPEETRLKLGITPNLIRFSVGIEDADDLIGDLREGLDALHV